MIADHLDILVIARIGTSAQPPSRVELARALRRFAPSSLLDGDWRTALDAACDRLRTTGVADAAGRLVQTGELRRRIAAPDTATWAQLAERILPALALGVAATDTKASARLVGRDAWTAAIAGRALGFWHDGPPPSLAAVCDAYAWTSLGLSGRAKRCPPEIRALFLQRELGADPGPPDRLLRLFTARVLEAPRAELRVLRDALVRMWLVGKPIAPATRDFASAARAAAALATSGVFGPHKVFISALWQQLRGQPGWAQLTLADTKRRLFAAHRAGQLELARADLVAAMDPELVAASETIVDGATFHFVVRKGA